MGIADLNWSGSNFRTQTKQLSTDKNGSFDQNDENAAIGKGAIDALQGISKAVLTGMDMKFEFASARMEIMHGQIMNKYKMSAINASCIIF